MPDTLEVIHDTQVLICGAEGDPIGVGQPAIDLIGGAAFQRIRWVVLPVERLVDGFFSLRSGIAGELTQKFVNYRVGLAVLGDVSRHTAVSVAFRDYVRESNRGRHVWFVSSIEEFTDRLAPGS